MPKVQRIQSLDDPGLSPYRTLRRPADHLREGIFVAEGEKVVRRLLATPIEVKSLLVTPEWSDKLLPGLNRDEAVLYVAERELLETIVGFRLHQGIMAVGKIPQERDPGKIIRESRSPNLFVALDGLVSAENVGVVVRNCAAFGVQALIAGELSSSPYLRRAVRNSMGAVFSLPVCHTADLRRTLRELRNEHRFSVIATLPQAPSTIATAEIAGDAVLVLGNEGSGMSEGVLEECTHHIAIPMDNDTDSINVGSASAVFLYELRRRRENPSSTPLR